MKTIEGNLTAEKLKFALVVSRFNNFLTARLLEGALDALKRHGAEEKNLTDRMMRNPAKNIRQRLVQSRHFT